ncbi:DUF2568 domain-containing protein [Peterkaempfera sp. SMS 1(5)a]|uniref:DUF2568 domain-containing protein n=1 Tax=Peterkaempfera podocarpi TaxID=3232308 RepID=UPI00366A65E4
MTDVVHGVVAVLSFLLEVAVLGAAGLWGLSLRGSRRRRVSAAVGAVAAAVAVWALFGAEEGAVVPLHGVARARRWRCCGSAPARWRSTRPGGAGRQASLWCCTCTCTW